jgi:hypothetical protein
MPTIVLNTNVPKIGIFKHGEFGKCALLYSTNLQLHLEISAECLQIGKMFPLIGR